jgi:hypothetical protein
MRILRGASQLFASTITIAKAANDHEVIMTFMVIRKMPVFAAFALVMVGPLFYPLKKESEVGDALNEVI